ncbi:hypothetical protein M0R45_002029 [Rubus argutus]|uniref:Uncharacterized protein n=1 Tax=Rubus argutus TaxID=59490 RepID=A0AAW1VIS2_RUBAR
MAGQLRAAALLGREGATAAWFLRVVGDEVCGLGMDKTGIQIGLFMYQGSTGCDFCRLIWVLGDWFGFGILRSGDVMFGGGMGFWFLVIVRP